MRRLLCLFLSLFVFPAFAVTSESYVDAAVNTLQDEIHAIDANTVLINTGSSGEIGTKQIYDSTQSFATQAHALVTAETFNAAVQNALDNEFVCIESIPEGCLLYQIRPVITRHTLPAGYTMVEYLQGNHSGTINTGVIFDQGSLKYSLEMQNSSIVNDNTPGDYSKESDFIGNVNGTTVSNGFVSGVFCRLDEYRCNSTHSALFSYVYPSSVGARFNKTNNQWHMIEAEFIDSSQIFTVDGEKLIINRNVYHTNSPIFLMGGSSTYKPATDSVKIRNIKIWRNDVLVRDYVTVRNANNVYGVYDFVNNTFTPTTNGSALSGGPDMPDNLWLPAGG